MYGKLRPFPGAFSIPRSRRLILIVWIFVGIVACLLAAAVYSVGLLAAGRAYVGAEGVWSSAQKEALLHLTRYVIDRQESDYRSYERAIAIPRGDRQARLALDRPQPDFEAARAGFLQGRNHPADLDGMIALFQRFRHFGSGERAMELWAKADSYLEELAAVAREARQAGARAERAQSARLLARIDRVNAALAPLEEEIAATLTGAQRAAQSVLLAGMLLLAGTLLVAAVALSKRLVRHNEALQHTLHENEGQLRRLIEAAPLPLLILRASDQGLLYANERALQQFALDVDSARERAFSDFYVDPAGREALGLALERGSVRDYEVEMKDYAGKRFWLLLSAQRLQYAGEACLLTALANIDDRKRMQDDMRHRAMHDPLTSLPNRAMFMEALDRAVRKARRRSACFSLLFIDLDRFKDVNDSLGHLAGDELLQAVGERLSAAVRQSDLVARLGGDEFVVLIEEHGGPEQVMIVAQKVLALLERPVIIDWREVSISASIGVASFPEDGQDHEALMKNADLAMYQAKERGRNNFQFYSVELNRLSIQRSELEKRLRGALERDEFFLLYQPEIDLKTGRLLGVEALLRWQDPAAGLVFPADFLPLAEETGTIIAIGRWVLEHALRDLKSWRDEGREFTLAVNISARQFQHHGLVNEVFRALQTHGVAPRQLRLEVTETTLMHDPPAAERALRALKGLGVEIALDDFGIGQSSLGLVRRFPIHVVKVDRSVVSGCPQKRECVAIVQAVCAMTHTLGLRAVAEGVETAEQHRAIAALGCDSAQGYLLGRPVEAAQVARLTEESTATTTR